MDSYFITALAIGINLITLYITYLTASGNLADNRFKKWYKKLKIKGWLFILAGLILVSTQLAQTYFTERQNKKEQEIRDLRVFEKLKHSSDSSVTEFQKSADLSVSRFKKSSDSSTFEIVQSLGKYKLKYDSSQKKIVNLIKDSSKTRVIEPENPTVVMGGELNSQTLAFLDMEAGHYYYEIYFTSLNSTSRNFDIKSSIIVFDSTTNLKYIYKGQVEIFEPNAVLPKDFPIRKKFEVFSEKPFGLLGIWNRGNYYNNDLTKVFLYDEMFYYNPNTKKAYKVTGDSKKNFTKYIQQIEK
jgi:hypothetical protein